MKASVFIATSLDGFIARENGDLDWLEGSDPSSQVVSDQEDYGYEAFMESIDVLVLGRISYEKVLSFGAWPYGTKRVIVLSSNIIEIPKKIAHSVSHSSESPKLLHKRLAEEGANRLYIDGGITIQRFLAEGLITDLCITIIPLILGGGIPLFGYLKDGILLKHIETKSYEFGFVQVMYEVQKDVK